ncbi:MAG: hypothetical protein Q9163_003833 [Psora crenata]
MQPEPNDTFQTDSLNLGNQDIQESSQHGLAYSYLQHSQQHFPGEPRVRPWPSSPRTALSDTSSEGSAISGGASEEPLRRLNTSSFQTRSLVDQVLTHILSHLPPASLSEVSLVSKHFNQLVTTPHAWRSGFSRFFPGAEALSTTISTSELSEGSDAFGSERRYFTRLTPLASWRSEYILRTRLLRALARGKPADLADQGSSGLSRSSAASTVNAQITYSSNLVSAVNHLHADFGHGRNKKLPRFIHGTDDLGAASTSDPRIGKVDAWGSQDPSTFRQFTDHFPGEAQYGLGTGDVVGTPNVMDLSLPLGMIYGEGLPGGLLWYRHLQERRCRPLLWSTGFREPEHGVPLLGDGDAICSVWIAKSTNVPDVSQGLIGILAGSSTGVITAYSVGVNEVSNRRIERGEITARWVLSPGVPIIAIVVDENISPKRLAARRIWAVTLNAMGEAFCLTDMPARPEQDDLRVSDPSSGRTQHSLERLAWTTGRSVHWKLIEPTRRLAKIDPFDRSDVDGSYSPRSSCNEAHLSREQLVAETSEVEGFLQKKPKDFRNVCHGWDMRRRLEVDFAASDDLNAGECVVVVGCGMDEGTAADVKRYSRCKIEETCPPLSNKASATRTDGYPPNNNNIDSLFADSSTTFAVMPNWSFADTKLARHDSTSDLEPATKENFIEEWRTSSFTFGGLTEPQITSTTIDMSKYASLTTSEDLLFSTSCSSAASSPMSSPLGSSSRLNSSNGVPGNRARLMAVGTKTGTILLYNMRASIASNAIIENSIKPVRIVDTDSPQISCLALTSLYMVHGGNDGLVQAWDPLASTTDPVRTLNSRFSSRARRRLMQAEASPAGVGINLYAAGAICLDPDPTVLRGVVSIGSHLRYWSYSSIAADQYKGNKRRLRRSERGSNQSGDRFSGTGRGALKEYIANEKLELEREKHNKRKEAERLAGRFGVDLLGPGASEDEVLAYATMLSEESAESDELKRKSASSTSRSETITREDNVSAALPEYIGEADNDVAEAIRLSLQESGKGLDAGSPHVPIKYAGRTSFSSSPPTTLDTTLELDDDLEYALQLSLAEQESKVEAGKGKERAD